MKNNSKLSFGRLWRIALAAIVMVSVPVAGFTQETTAGIRGKIFDEAGAPVAGATVVIEDMRTGARRNLTSNESGTFLAAKLSVGGPYKVTVAGTKSVMVDSISL
ncbi:MAG: carboxypeptidase-like regulatory domain-containing protein, partial [Gammaproteobacteria bacterium]|nr:carboxypeptidase-like regulatory domain-containing protein [Gammaproteobacteria bacterium]